jgi:hypothetical protein
MHRRICKEEPLLEIAGNRAVEPDDAAGIVAFSVGGRSVKGRMGDRLGNGCKA